MKKSGCKLSFIVIFIVFLLPGCTGALKESDLIIEVDKNSLVKVSETDVLSYFEKNRDSFKAVSEYMLKNGKIFGTRPIILNKEDGISKIQDETIKKLAETLLQEGIVTSISSLDDSIKHARFLTGYEHGVYTQGIQYVSDNKAVEDDKTEYNYVKQYIDLGDGWFYYIYYYNKIKDGDAFRKAAWDKLSQHDRKSVIYDLDKAIVTLKDWESVRYKTGKTRYPFVVSVCFNTDVDGLLGPIIIYFDPSTKEAVGYELRY